MESKESFDTKIKKAGLGKAGVANGSNVATFRRCERLKGQKDGGMIALAMQRAASKNNIPKSQKQGRIKEVTLKINSLVQDAYVRSHGWNPSRHRITC